MPRVAAEGGVIVLSLVPILFAMGPHATAALASIVNPAHGRAVDAAETAFWPYVHVLEQLALALALGLFIGLERERRGKRAGLRTFGFCALIPALGGLLGLWYALLCLAFVGLLAVLLDIDSMRADEGAELTTAAALMVTGLTGLLCGVGHTLTPVAVAVATVGLLTWKWQLTNLTAALTETELQSAILLGVLAFVVYPALPTGTVDPWHLIDVREAWITVILIAALGFVNYLLLKLYGARGAILSGFLGGLLNSKVAVIELANRVRQSGGALRGIAEEGFLLATIAAIVRTLGLLAVLAPRVLIEAVLPYVAMLALCGIFMAIRFRRGSPQIHGSIPLSSPFSLVSAIRFGVLFTIIEVAGTLAQRELGSSGFYAVNLIGGLVSSASTVASAAILAADHTITPPVAAVGVVLSTFSSISVNVVLFGRMSGEPAMTRRVARMVAIIVGIGVVGAVVELGILGHVVG